MQGKNIVKGNCSGKYFSKLVLLVLITSSVVILFSSLISKSRQERLRLEEAEKTLEKQYARLRTENKQLNLEYPALLTDPVRIEQEAREKLGYTGPDEIVYPKYSFRVKNSQKNMQEKSVPQNTWIQFVFEEAFPWQIPALIILISTAYFLISYHYEYRKLRKPDC
ncbi:MAG: septum formation initiator family protein [Candidatus Brocadiaceae bacterium]|nr:septum formation initiator family protein [Candidatus Brocadiaceae bacterium]